MRVRTRNTTKNLSGKMVRMFKRRTNCSDPASVIETVSEQYTITLNTKVSEETISDVVTPLTEFKRFRNIRTVPKDFSGNRRRAGVQRSFMPVKPCTHVKTSLTFCDAFSTINTKTACDSSSGHMWTTTYTNGAVYLAANHGLSDPYGQLVPLIPGNTVGAFKKHDWFALASQFDEACDSFIPSSSMLGETMMETDIFVDAFKIMVNPSLALKKFFLSVRLLGLEKKNLGTIARMVRNSSNAYLSYNFGVKPAIGEIKACLSAHQKVQQRLDFLSKYSGSYVPIRVRQKLSSAVGDPYEPPSYPIVTQSTYQKVYSERSSIATIGAWGRVREDLNWNDVWKAYLQYFGINKVVGLAWELIPYSFVIDWFTNAQERINKISRTRIGDPFAEIRSISASVTEETKSLVYLLPGFDYSISAYTTVPNGKKILAEISQKSYTRFNTIPSTSGVVDFSTLGLFHLATSAALLLKRWKK